MVLPYRRLRVVLTILTAVLATTCQIVSATVVYCDGQAAGANNGTSWGDAYTNLQDAINNAIVPRSEIWVAAGIYYPTSTVTRTASFTLRSSFALYGGFLNGMVSRSERDWSNNVTLLNGDLGRDDLPGFSNRLDNAYHVVSAANDSILDGFTIRGGYADAGGGNNGGGIFCAEDVSPVIANCLITDNYAVQSGAGLYSFKASTELLVHNCVFDGNRVDTLGNDYGAGAGFQLGNGVRTVTRCLFTNNTAAHMGGGLFGLTCPVTIRQCTFVGNFGSPTSDYGPTGAGAYLMPNGYSTVVEDSVFDRNRGRDGAGLFIATAGPYTMNRLAFFGNSARGDGGAVYANNCGAVPFVNCVFVGNVSSNAGGSGGGAILISQPTVGSTMMHCTVVSNRTASDNRQGGGLIIVNGGVMSISNSIFWANSVLSTSTGRNVCVVGNYATEVTIGFSDFEGGIESPSVVLEYSLGVLTNCIANTNLDPQFVNPAGHDGILGSPDDNLQLMPGSPCRDIASPDGAPDVDILLQSRPQGDGFDMGAYEAIPSESGFTLTILQKE